MKMLITVDGKSYNVQVQVLEEGAPGSTPGSVPAASGAAATAPAAPTSGGGGR